MPTTSASVSPGAVTVPSVDWRAIIAGAIAASALSALLMAFGAALGLSLTSAKPMAGFSGNALAILAAVWLAFVHVIGFACGGYLTGRMRLPFSPNSQEREFRDGAHGALVWALGSLIGAYLVASTASGVISKTVDAAAHAVDATAQMATAGSGPLGELVSYNVDRMLRSSNATTGPAANPALSTRDTAEITRIVTVSLANGSLSPADKEYLTVLVASRSGVTPQDAARRVDEAYAALAQKKVELEIKARETADAARKASVLTAFLTAAVSLVGLVAAAWAAGRGGLDRDENRFHPRLMGQARFW